MAKSFMSIGVHCERLIGTPPASRADWPPGVATQPHKNSVAAMKDKIGFIERVSDSSISSLSRRAVGDVAAAEAADADIRLLGMADEALQHAEA